MKTPIFDFVHKYAGGDVSRFHMPGHKGRPFLGFENLDITEIKGAGDLYAKDGIVAESEALATSLFGFQKTFYAPGGSSQCIKAMLYLVKQMAKKDAGATVLAGRGAHRAFIHALALNDFDVRWIYPENDAIHSYGVISVKSVEAALCALTEKPAALYLTFPDYYGALPDAAGIAALCRRHNIPFLVDNAHGAYLRFLNPSLHPVSLGADFSCDSAHKTLPVLTGGAYLHCGKTVRETIIEKAKDALSLFGSSSPSYLILQSLDLCNAYLSSGYEARLAEFAEKVSSLRERLRDAGWALTPSDPLRLVIDAFSKGYTGNEAAVFLREKKIECEFSENRYLILMLTPENTPDDLLRLEKALSEMPAKGKKTGAPAAFFASARKVMTVRDAVMGKSEKVNIKDAIGRICALPVTVCPPGIPIIVSGEEIDKDAAAFLEQSGIRAVAVVAK